MAAWSIALFMLSIIVFIPKLCSCFDSACLLAWQICPYQLVCNTSWGNVFLSLRDIITFITSLIGLWALPAIGQASAFKFVKNGSGAEVWISSASCAPSSWIKTRLVILFVNTEIRIDVLAYHVVFSIVRIFPPPQLSEQLYNHPCYLTWCVCSWLIEQLYK